MDPEEDKLSGKIPKTWSFRPISKHTECLNPGPILINRKRIAGSAPFPSVSILQGE